MSTIFESEIFSEISIFGIYVTRKISNAFVLRFVVSKFEVQLSVCHRIEASFDIYAFHRTD